MVADNEWIFQPDTGSLAEKHSRLPWMFLIPNEDSVIEPVA